eukprot:gene1164-biopygen2360
MYEEGQEQEVAVTLVAAWLTPEGGQELHRRCLQAEHKLQEAEQRLSDAAAASSLSEQRQREQQQQQPCLRAFSASQQSRTVWMGRPGWYERKAKWSSASLASLYLPAGPSWTGGTLLLPLLGLLLLLPADAWCSSSSEHTLWCAAAAAVAADGMSSRYIATVLRRHAQTMAPRPGARVGLVHLARPSSCNKRSSTAGQCWVRLDCVTAELSNNAIRNPVLLDCAILHICASSLCGCPAAAAAVGDHSTGISVTNSTLHLQQRWQHTNFRTFSTFGIRQQDQQGRPAARQPHGQHHQHSYQLTPTRRRAAAGKALHPAELTKLIMQTNRPQQLLELVAQHQANMDYKHMSAALSCLAKMQVAAADRAAVQQLLVLLEQLLLPLLNQCGLRALSNTAWACSKLQHTNTALFSSCVARYMQQAEHVDQPQSVSNVLWAAAKSHFLLDEQQVQQLLAVFTRPNILQQVKPQDVSNMLWAVAKMAQQLDQQQVQQLLTALLRQHQHLKPQEVSNTLWAVATMGQQIHEQQL